MKRLKSLHFPWVAPLMLVCGICTGSPVYLDRDLEVDLAVAAAPEHLRTQAKVFVFEKSGYKIVREGSNGFTCLVNRDGAQSGDAVIRPTCWDPEGSATIVPVVLKVGEMIARGATAQEITQRIAHGFVSGEFKSPQKTGIAYMLRGDIEIDPQTQKPAKTLFPPHYMIYAPGVTNADIGVDEAALKKNPSLPFIYAGYSGGERTAYLIVMATDSHGR